MDSNACWHPQAFGLQNGEKFYDFSQWLSMIGWNSVFSITVYESRSTLISVLWHQSHCRFDVYASFSKQR